jgi:hypothetical protein
MKHFCALQNFLEVVLRFLVVAVFAMPVAAQNLGFGVKAGVPAMDPFILSPPSTPINNYSFTTKRYTVGPTFELGLPYHLAFEADALYKRLHYVSNPFGFNTFLATTTANSWEFPLLLKGHLLHGTIRPYANLGVSFRHIGGETSFSNGSFQATQDPLELIHPWSTGFVGGGGADFKWGWLRFSPEVRYTRWSNASFNSSNGVLGSNRNAVEVLVGVIYTSESQ